MRNVVHVEMWPSVDSAEGWQISIGSTALGGTCSSRRQETPSACGPVVVLYHLISAASQHASLCAWSRQWAYEQLNVKKLIALKESTNSIFDPPNVIWLILWTEWIIWHKIQNLMTKCSFFLMHYVHRKMEHLHINKIFNLCFIQIFFNKLFS